MVKKELDFGLLKSARGLGRTARGLAGVGITTGIAANVVERAGGNPQGLNVIANYQAPIANAMGAGLVINSLKDFAKVTKIKRKKGY